MPIDSDGLGLDAVLATVLGTMAGVAVAAIGLALVASRHQGRRVRPTDLVLSMVVVVAVIVVVVVGWRIAGGDVTGWDLLWAAGSAISGSWCAARLFGRRLAVTRSANS